MRKSVLSVLGISLVILLAGPVRLSAHLRLRRRQPILTPSIAPALAPGALTVPARTEVRARLLSGMQTQFSRVDDPIEAQLLSPVYVRGRIALPAGTLFGGHLTTVRPAGPFHRPAEMALRFDQVTLPDGQQAPVSAFISKLENQRGLNAKLDSEGYIEGRRHFSWRDAVAGVASACGFAAAKALALSTTTAAIVGPAGGAAFVAYELLWAHGGEVNLPPQTRCRIRLYTPVTVQSIS
jgi:hypothetical protein